MPPCVDGNIDLPVSKVMTPHFIASRFEKRIYIPLPEAPARQRMFKIHLGDTPNSLTDEDYKKLGATFSRTCPRRYQQNFHAGLLSNGMSGSDISVVVREAVMEPLRKCRTAQFFRKDKVTGLVSSVVIEIS
jgi:vacuolar protein-sorting-associated protein 4